MTRETLRWQGVTALAFAAGAAGILLTSPPALLVAVVGVAYAAYARSATEPTPDVALERTVSETRVDPGDEVDVEVTVTNRGDGVLPDLRVVDGVPAALEVVDGSPRLATALRPGKRAGFRYTVAVERGRHEFDDATVVARDVTGAAETETEVGDETVVECVPDLGELGTLPLRKQTSQLTGRVTTDTAGSGIEFHSTREYRPGDPLTRIDWNRKAKTGDLTTIEFREERAATVVVVVDTREPSYVADADEVTGVEYSVAAAGQVVASLLDHGDRVGLASLGERWTWVAPGLGRVHRTALTEALALGGGFQPVPADRQFLGGLSLRRIRKHAPGDAQIVLVTPVADGYVPLVARRLEAYGHAVTVVSPDLTDGDTPGSAVAGLERAHRLAKMRAAGVRVLDWDTDRPLAVAVANATRRWQR